MDIRVRLGRFSHHPLFSGDNNYSLAVKYSPEEAGETSGEEQCSGGNVLSCFGAMEFPFSIKLDTVAASGSSLQSVEDVATVTSSVDVRGRRGSEKSSSVLVVEGVWAGRGKALSFGRIGYGRRERIV